MIALTGVCIGLALICAFFSGVFADRNNDVAGGWFYAAAIGLGFAAVAFASAS